MSLTQVSVPRGGPLIMLVSLTQVSVPGRGGGGGGWGCHHLGKEKCYFCRKRVYFYKFCQRLQKEESMRLNLLHLKGLLFD